jgi:hypothetical protein
MDLLRSQRGESHLLHGGSAAYDPRILQALNRSELSLYALTQSRLSKPTGKRTLKKLINKTWQATAISKKLQYKNNHFRGRYGMSFTPVAKPHGETWLNKKYIIFVKGQTMLCDVLCRMIIHMKPVTPVLNIKNRLISTNLACGHIVQEAGPLTTEQAASSPELPPPHAIRAKFRTANA